MESINHILDEHRYYRKQVVKLLKMDHSEDNSITADNFESCSGHQEGNKYIVELKGTDKSLRRMEFTMDRYKNEIRPMKATWINNRILNRSEMSVRIWGNENSPNKLRRRLEQKAERGTLTRAETQIIIKELILLIKEINQK